MIICFSTHEHFGRDRPQGRKVHRGDIPDIIRIDPVIFMAQQVADTNDRLTMYILIATTQFTRQFFRGFRNDLHRAFDGEFQNDIAARLFRSRALNRTRYDFNLLENMGNSNFGMLCRLHQKTRTELASI